MSSSVNMVNKHFIHMIIHTICHNVQNELGKGKTSRKDGALVCVTVRCGCVRGGERETERKTVRMTERGRDGEIG